MTFNKISIPQVVQNSLHTAVERFDFMLNVEIALVLNQKKEKKFNNMIYKPYQCHAT